MCLLELLDMHDILLAYKGGASPHQGILGEKERSEMDNNARCKR